MGSRTKLALASLVSLMIMLSFAIGLVPSQQSVSSMATAAQGNAGVAISVDGWSPVGNNYSIPVGGEQGFTALSTVDGESTGLVPAGEAEWSLHSDGAADLNVAEGDLVATVSAHAPGEAGLYVVTGDGLVDMVHLNLYALKAAHELYNVEITQPSEGTVVIFPEGAVNQVLSVASRTDSVEDTESVEYTLTDADSNVIPLGSATAPPYSVTILGLENLQGANSLYAEASGISGNSAADTANFFAVPFDADNNNTGIPDNPFLLDAILDFIGVGDSIVWKTLFVDGDISKIVWVSELTSSPAKQLVIPDDGLEIVIQDPAQPSRLLRVVVPAGLAQALDEGVEAYIIVQGAFGLTELLGDAAADVGALPAGGLVDEGIFAEITILTSADDGQTYAPIDSALLEEFPILLIQDGLVVSEGDNVRFFAYPTEVTDTDAGDDLAIDIVPVTDSEWTPVPLGTNVETGRVWAQLNSLSIIAPFDTTDALQITGVTPVDTNYSIGGAQLDVAIDNAAEGVGYTITIDGIEAGSGTFDADGSVVVSVTAPPANALAAPAASASVDIQIDVDQEIGGVLFDVLADGVTYVGPNVATIDPAEGPETGSTQVEVTGEGFAAGLSASLGPEPLRNISVSGSTSFTATTRPSATGTVELSVTNPDNYTGSLADAFDYTQMDPIITSVTPSAAFKDEPTLITINGLGFADPSLKQVAAVHTGVYFTDDPEAQDPVNDDAATDVNVLSSTQIQALTPVRENAGESNIYVVTTIYDGTGAKQLPVTRVSALTEDTKFTFTESGLTVFIEPQGAIDAGAMWRLSRAGELYGIYSSGQSVGVEPGDYTIDFTEVSGFTAPAPIDRTIAAGENAEETGTYIQNGTLTVNIEPQGAIDAGAMWRLAGTDDLYSSGDTIEVTPGSYTVEFTDVDGFITPAPIDVTVAEGAAETVTGIYGESGTLTVTIEPQAAIDAGAMWQLSRAGEVYGVYSSGEQLQLEPGTYTITFTDVAGFTTPAEQNADVVAGEDTAVTGTYIVVTEGFGNLQVFIEPAAAVADGARWRLAGEADFTRESGDTIEDIEAGSDVTVEFSDVATWITPAAQTVTILQDQTQTVTGTYMPFVIDAVTPDSGPLAGGNAVEITGGPFPVAEVAGAVCPPDVESPNILRVGCAATEADTVSIPVYIYRDGSSDDAASSIDFQLSFDPAVLSPQLEPPVGPQQPVTFVANDNLFLWYQKGVDTNLVDAGNGVIAVVISGGIREITTVDDQRGSANTGAEENPFLLGHFEFNVVGQLGDISPLEVTTITMSDRDGGNITPAEGLRSQDGVFRAAESLTDDDPTPAVRVLFGGNEAEVDHANSTSTTIFVTAPAGDAPGAVDVRVEDLADANRFAVAPGAYTYLEPEDTGTLTVNIEPQEAVDAGAMWSLAGSAELYNSGQSVELEAGNYTVEFTNVTGFVTPASQPVTVVANEETIVTGTYGTIPPGQGALRVNIEPQAAIDAGAMWRIAGTEQLYNSGDVLFLELGDYTIEFTDVDGFTTPAPQTVTVVEGETTQATGTYTLISPSTLTVFIEPQDAIDAGARWRLAGEAAYVRESGDVVQLDPGVYTVQFSTVNGFLAPANIEVSLDPGASVEVTGVYTVDEDAPVIDEVSPGAMWVFGGEVARVTGANLDRVSEFFFDAAGNMVAAEFAPRAQSASEVWLNVPPMTGFEDGEEASRTADILGRVDGEEAARTIATDAFTYVRYLTEVFPDGDGTIEFTTTAFMVDTGAGETSKEVVLPTDQLGTAFVSLPGNLPEPAKTDEGTVFGLARTSKSKGLTGNDYANPGGPVDNIWAFDLYLYKRKAELTAEDELVYEAKEVKFNTPAATTKALLSKRTSASGLGTFIELSYPVDDTALTLGHVQQGRLTTWGRETSLDNYAYFRENTMPVQTSPVVHYQSILVAGDYEPAAGASTTGLDRVNTRVYNLGKGRGLSLRLNASLVDVSGADFADTSPTEGPFDGGTAVVIEGEGLAWPQQVLFENTTTKQSAAGQITSPIGENEYVIEVTSPQFPAANVDTPVNVKVVLLNGDEIVLPTPFVYKAARRPVGPAVLAALAALLGLLAGDRGDGDGGPCFIATAAYGTPMASEIDTLRVLRDEYLLTNAAGAAFVDAYYRVSPAIADVVAKSPVLAAVVRMALIPVIAMAKLVVAMPQVSALLMALMAMLAVRRSRKARKA